ncbi:MAG: polynucleotide adenylyltransferase PcnB [Vicinamibacterales bacterium]
MPDPVIVPRAEHTVSRRDIDPDALKVLHRLHQFHYAAYLVGGSVRDLLLGRRPKDFDIGTSAHPYQVKKLFRNCWIIGRRFRLAHVRFGNKAIEVATFRRHVPPGTENEPAEPPPDTDSGDESSQDLLIRHDNTFGTPEEDAFRRDFTVNALFYDIGTFSIIDYVGGLEDLRAGLIRSIGDPNQRFQEDPVRMFRAVAMAARLDFTLDKPIVHALGAHGERLALASPARLIEEYYKVLRSGAAEKTFRGLAAHGLLQAVTPDLLERDGGNGLWPALAQLDTYRRRFPTIPATLTNPVLLGTLLVPLGLMPRRRPGLFDLESEPIVDPVPAPRGRPRPPKEPLLMIGILPVARRDTERLRQILSLQRRLLELDSSPRAKRALMHRGPFEDALTWLDIHGRAPEVLEHWRGFVEAASGLAPASPTDAGGDGTQAPPDPQRRSRRRGSRRGRRGGRQVQKRTE